MRFSLSVLSFALIAIAAPLSAGQAPVPRDAGVYAAAGENNSAPEGVVYRGNFGGPSGGRARSDPPAPPGAP